jgi:hypothetical protein
VSQGVLEYQGARILLLDLPVCDSDLPCIPQPTAYVSSNRVL